MISTAYRAKYSCQINENDFGNVAEVAGWVHEVRKLGGIAFILLRDRFGIVQVTAIKKELGEFEDESTDIEDLREKLESIKMPKDVYQVAEKELNRLARMSPMASEYTVSRTYLDWLLEMPWNKKTRDRLDVKKAEQILNEDHYDLEKVSLL